MCLSIQNHQVILYLDPIPTIKSETLEYIYIWMIAN